MTLSLAALLVSPTVSLVQAPSPPFDATAGRVMPWGPGSWQGGHVTSVVHGDFTGSLYGDLALLEGEDLVLAFGVGRFTSRTLLTTSVTGVCTAPDAAPSGSDALVVATGNGFATIWLDGENQDPVQVNAVDDPQWADASKLVALEDVGSGLAVAAVDSTDTHVLVLDAPFGNQSTTTLGPLGGACRALTPVDWTGDGRDELAVVHDHGVEIWDRTAPSAPLAAFDLGQGVAGAAAVALADPGASTERLAVALDRQAGPGELWVFDLAGQESVVLATGTPAQVIARPYAIAAGDVDGDQRDDLIVAHRDPTLAGPVLYENVCNGPAGPCTTFEPAASHVLDLGVAPPDPSAQRAQPVLADTTGDGDLDLAVFSAAEPVLRIAENLTVDHAQQLVSLDVPACRGLLDPDDETGAVRTSFTPPGALTPFEPNGVLVEQWYQQIDTDHLHPAGVQAFLFEWPTLPQEWPIEEVLVLYPPWVPIDGVTHLTVRAVRTSGDQVLEAGPANVHSISLSESSVEFLDGTFGALGLSIVLFPIRFVDLPQPSLSLTPTYQPLYEGGSFEENSFTGAGGGDPPDPPPLLDGDPPRPPTI